MPHRKLVTVALLLGAMLHAQITTGVVEGMVRHRDGSAAADVPVTAVGALFRRTVHSDSGGRFALVLPYGEYQIGGVPVFVAALGITRVNLTASAETSSPPAMWIDTTRARVYPDPFSIAGILLSREPAMVTAPLDLTGLRENALPLVSDRAMSWTATEFKLNGMDATDPYQPGRPLLVAAPESIEQLSVRSGFSETTSTAYASEVGAFVEEAGAAWHGSVSTAASGSIFSSSNLPSPADRGLIQQPDSFRWFSRDAAQTGGPIAKWADLFASVAGQGSSQTVPLAAPGTDQNSRLLYLNARARMRAGARDRFDALYSGSRLNLSNFATPAGLEALTASAASPSFVLPIGFAGQSEGDRFDHAQFGWTHAAAGFLEVRCNLLLAYLNTTGANGPSTIELLDGAVSGAPPLNNRASRSRQAIEASWQPASTRQHFVAGAGWHTANARNRMTAPSNLNLISAAGAPAFALELNTPADWRETVQSFTAGVADHINLSRNFSLDAAVLADFSRGGPIAWNSLSPRAAFAWQIPRARGLLVRGGYFRADAPLAARDLDYANPNSLGGSEYQWLGGYAPVQTGALLMRFGGPYSSISPSLQRPYADEFDLGAQYQPTHAVSLTVQLYRRDDRNRIAAIDTGVPFSAYTPVSIIDAYAEQAITVYAQNPATFGEDRYLLTNPPDLRFETSGIVAGLLASWRGFTFQAWFTAQNAWGPANPGDAAIENDPGMIGALYSNPNTLINSSSRNYFDRGFIGKMQAAYRLPCRIELASTAVYLDGLPFARQLLVTGLPQGPIVVAATIRGNPGDGNRAQYVINWNLSAQREFRARVGAFTAGADVLNVTNAGEKIQESDLSAANFQERLPVAIQSPRSVRLFLRYEF